MRTFNKRLISIALTFFILILPMIVPSYVLTVDAVINAPSTVRIGIYFANGYNDYTVKSSNLVQTSGFNIGVSHYGNFQEVYNKTGYTNARLIEEDGNTKYYIQYPISFNTSQEALIIVNQLAARGIEACVAYDGRFKVWSGSFSASSDAQSYLDNTIVPNDPGMNYTLIKPYVDCIRVEIFSKTILVVSANDSGYIQIKSINENNRISVDGKEYRGYFEARNTSGNGMTLINILPLEQYLYSVVPCEIEGDSNIEALKAQSVLARTYVIYNLGKHGNSGFDLCNTDCCQVYGGCVKEYYKSSLAVDQTVGQIVTYAARIAQVYYFASSGGMTANSENVWYASVPYLKSVEDSYESGVSYMYNWTKTLTVFEIKKILDSRGEGIGNVTDVRVLSVSESGRVTQLMIKGTAGTKIYSNGTCRTIFSLYGQRYYVNSSSYIPIKTGVYSTIGVKKDEISVKSANGSISSVSTTDSISVKNVNGSTTTISSTNTAATFSFVGQGKGHGVGMSQEGAKGMALRGYTYQQILAHYFSGTTITTIN